MNGAKGKFADFISRLKAEMRQDKKKTTMLVILLIVAGIVGGRFVVTHGPTDAASAIGSAGAAKRLISDTAEDTRTGWGRNSEHQARQVDFASMDRTINRDLFRPDAKYFPSAGQADKNPIASRPEHVKSIRTQAEALYLTGTMPGRSPRALINGQVLRAGEMIKGFHLKSIAPDYCIVDREGVDVKLQMRE